MKEILKILFNNPVLANILMLLILISGLIGWNIMIREMFPRFSMDTISVSVSYPGADPEEIEEGICLKLEEALEGIEGIKKIDTYASEGSGTATIECEEGADVREVQDEVKSQVDSITTFPVDAENPVVAEAKFRGDVLSIIIWGDLPERQLKELARKFEQEVLGIKGVSQTSISGIRDYEISIEVSEEKLRKYNLTFDDISSAIKRNSMNLPAGTLRTGVEDIRIRAVGRKYRAKEYRNIPVISTKDGTVVTLGQIADIKDVFDDDAKLYALFNGYPAVSLDIYQTEDEDAINIASAIDDFIARKKAELPENVHLTKFKDRSRMIKDRLRLLLDNGKIGLILVFVSLWIFLDLRLSFWVTMGIPISLAGGLAIMAVMGESINMLSLFGMIMVLGLIVDDAIVVGESIYAKRQDGMKPFDSAVKGTAEVALPVVAAVLTTIVAFIPLFYVRGVMGKFIRVIPVPVVAALSVSLLEGLFILPVHLRHLPVPGLVPRHKIARGPYYFRKFVADKLDFFINSIYGPTLDYILHWRYAGLCVGIAVLMIIGGMVKGGIIKFVMFPKNDSDFIRAKVELPAGTPIAQTKAAAKLVMDGWHKVEDKYRAKGIEGLATAVYSIIGGGMQYHHGRVSSSSTNELQVAIELMPSEKRNIHYQELVNAWKKATGNIPGSIATNFESFRRGPGGMPVEIRLMGNDQKELLAASDELLNKLESIEGVFDAQLDYRPGKREFILNIKPEAYRYGLTLDDLAEHVKGGFYGNEALRIQRGRDDIRVKVRYPGENGRDSVEYFERLRVKTPAGNYVPFLSVAELKLAEGPSQISRRERKRYVTVQADVNDKKANAREILTALQNNFMPELLSRYDISYSTEGQEEETRDSLSSLFIGFPLALFGIYFIIASIFRSYIQPLVIMTTIPFGLVGAVIGHMIFGFPITLLSMFGMVALAGIVVNDAIVLIEGVNIRLAEGMPLFEALREGGKRRFRAILLTTVTTFAGLMPLILEKSMQAQFLIPMAISIAFGVLFATLLTLVLIPCLLAILNDFRRVLYYFWYLDIPSREEVEPRSSFSKVHDLI